MRGAASFLMALLFLLASCGSRREQMVLHLEELEQRNMADSLLTNDSLAEALVAWFDDYGTPNERLRSRYILARTYADLGEAPRALEAFLDAAACADTAAPDCDFAKLSRVYGQMSELFYKQNLMDGFFEANDYSIKYAWKACDTLQALNESMYTLTAYDQKRNYDALIPMFDSLYTQFERYYGEAIASRYCIIPVKALIERRDLGKARKYLDLYESKSGYFDSSHHVNPGREAYYYYRGLYFLAMHQSDSAEFFFRKELAIGHDFLNLDMASRGLSLAFEQANKPDSAAKYSIYSYDMNDSVYASMATEETARMAAFYNYSLLQRQVNKEQQNVIRERTAKNHLILTLFSVALLFVIIIFIGISIWRKKRRDTEMKYQKKVEELIRAKEHLKDLYEQKVASEKLIDEKENVIAHQEKEIVEFMKEETRFLKLIEDKENIIKQKNLELVNLHSAHKNLKIKVEETELLVEKLQYELGETENADEFASSNADSALNASSLYKELMAKASKRHCLEESDWKDIESLLKSLLPRYHRFMDSHRDILTTSELQLCHLVRLNFDLKEIANILCINPSGISKLSAKVLAKLFNGKGSGKDLRKRLRGIS